MFSSPKMNSRARFSIDKLARTPNELMMCGPCECLTSISALLLHVFIVTFSSRSRASLGPSSRLKMSVSNARRLFLLLLALLMVARMQCAKVLTNETLLPSCVVGRSSYARTFNAISVCIFLANRSPQPSSVSRLFPSESERNHLYH